MSLEPPMPPPRLPFVPHVCLDNPCGRTDRCAAEPTIGDPYELWRKTPQAPDYPYPVMESSMTAQNLRCANGEHEADPDYPSHKLTDTKLAFWCRHCRCLYAEKP